MATVAVSIPVAGSGCGSSASGSKNRGSSGPGGRPNLSSNRRRCDSRASAASGSMRMIVLSSVSTCRKPSSKARAGSSVPGQLCQRRSCGRAGWLKAGMPNRCRSAASGSRPSWGAASSTSVTGISGESSGRPTAQATARSPASDSSSSPAAASAAYRAGSIAVTSARTSMPALASMPSPSRSASAAVPSCSRGIWVPAHSRAASSAASGGGSGRSRPAGGPPTTARLPARSAPGSSWRGSLRWSSPAASSRPATSSISSPSSTGRPCSSLAVITTRTNRSMPAQWTVPRSAASHAVRVLPNSYPSRICRGQTVPRTRASSGSRSGYQAGSSPSCCASPIAP